MWVKTAVPYHYFARFEERVWLAAELLEAAASVEILKSLTSTSNRTESPCCHESTFGCLSAHASMWYRSSCGAAAGDKATAVPFMYLMLPAPTHVMLQACHSMEPQQRAWR